MNYLKQSILLSAIAVLMGYGAIIAQTRVNGEIPYKGAHVQFEGQMRHGTDKVATYCATAYVSANTASVEPVNPQFTFERVEGQAAREIKAAGELGSDVAIKTYTGIERGRGVASFCFKPFVVRNGEVLRVVTYSIGYSQSYQQETVQRKASQVAASSVLANDGWYKVAVPKTGLYKITPSFLSSHGISASAVAINSLRVVGNGTGMLPEENADPRPDDLLDVPLKIYDQNNDGLFNSNDYAVFYAKGPHQWSLNETTGVFSHRTNIYRDQNFYFVSVINGPGKPVAIVPQLSAPATVQTTTYDEYDYRENETYNLVGTGRQWYGDIFDVELTKSFGFSFPNMDVSQDMRVKVRALARASTAGTSMDVTVGNSPLMSLNFAGTTTGERIPYANVQSKTANTLLTASPAGFTIRLTYQNAANPAGVAWLDYIEVQCKSQLNYRGVPLFFRNKDVVAPGSVASYTITNAPANMKVWRVSQHNDVAEVAETLNGQLLTFKDNADNLQEYVAFAGSNGLAEPTFVGAVPVQDLHAIAPPEMIIITHPTFLAAAQRLADFHTQNDNLQTTVVTVQEVYNEFSSGGQDISAIRDFVRHLYKKANGGSGDFKYLLLMGDASYDYKDRIANNSNFVPIWESEYSLNLGDSYITDDFYGFLDDNEGGNGNISSLSSDLLDIGIGRIPCATAAQAQAAVDKIINYTTGQERFGDWRSKILMMADDLDEGTWEARFVTASEIFQQLVNDEDNAFNVSKVYSDAYRQVSTTGGESYPEAHDEMFRRVQQGCLVTNYIGHGGEIGLSSEKLLGLQDVNGWTNFDALSLFLTITCEFTRLDDPKRVSAGEQLALNSRGGAIALLSTTRVVFADPAIDLNESIFKNVFKRNDNLPRTLGEITMRSKNGLPGTDTKLKFSLIGDPAVRLAIPLYNMQVNTINGKSVAQGSLDTLKALSKVKVTGQVNDFSNQKINDFDGIVSVSVYDKPTESETLVNDGIGSPIKFTLQNSLIYKGKVEVKQGEFSFEFIVPRDISFQYGYGKISLYADDNTVDAAGAYDTVLVGGFNTNPIEDDEGPQVALYINDETFVRGGVTNENPELYAVISDSSGINTVGNKIGHNLKATLDGDESQSFIVNEYYEADLNSYQSGKVRYPFYELEEGAHTLSLEVFDVHNNFSVAETDFIVADSEELALKRVLNYPNPFTTRTDFQFEHNRADHPLEVQVQIFTVSGKLVKTINRLVVSQGNRVASQVTWNGLDDYGDKIGKGVYVYRIKVRSQLDNSMADKYEKLVILR